jgi:glycosyltransferase involved in cell wall biosynthesis
MAIVFFHQNQISDQGGIERYLSALIDRAKPNAVLVTGADSSGSCSCPCLFVRLPLRRMVPKWLSYAFGVLLAAGRIRRHIKSVGSCTLEFSRPEYILFSWIFTGAKVFTIHGTGPSSSEGAKYWLHYFSTLIIPFAADVVQIVGRDQSGLPSWTLARMRSKVRNLDAWHDEVFRTFPFRDIDGPLKVFYAGRLAAMKNPELLFRIIHAADRVTDRKFEFRYFGADQDLIPAGIRQIFPSAGFLNAHELARAIADCHVGILCSGYGEGSPFIVAEALACGRAFVLPPLLGLLKAYQNYRGIVFADDYTVDAFIAALTKVQDAIRTGLTPESISANVAGRNKTEVAERIVRQLEADQVETCRK